MAPNSKAEATVDAAAAASRAAWRRSQGRKTIAELQGHCHRAPLLWMVIPFIAGATLQRLGGECPFPHPAWIAAGLSTAALLAAFGRSPLAHLFWTTSHCTAVALLGVIVLQIKSTEASTPLAYARPERRVVRISRISAPHRAEGRQSHRQRHKPKPATPIPASLDATDDDQPDSVESRSARPALSRGEAPPGGFVANGFGTLVESGAPVYFSIALSPDDSPPIRGEEVMLWSRAKPVPPRGGPDTFNGYLRGMGVTTELSPAHVAAVVKPPSWYAQNREALAQRMNDLLAAGFGQHPDLAAIYRAMMLGRKEGLTKTQKQLFVRSGTMHLFAINGLHIGIVALSAHALLTLLRVRGRMAAAMVLAILWLDVDSTGATPSAVRAFLMVALLEIGAAAPLPMNSLAALTGAAAAMLALDPVQLFGASFQMSFGVVTTLILLGVPLAGHLRARWSCCPPAGSAAGFSAAAALVSAITGVTYFTAWSPAGIPANLLLMPLATLVIIAGFAAIVSGLLHLLALTVLFNAAARVLLQVIVAALEHIVSVPAASFPAHLRAAWIGPAALAALLGSCVRGYARSWEPESGGWWPPFLVTACTMILGVKYG